MHKNQKMPKEYFSFLVVNFWSANYEDYCFVKCAWFARRYAVWILKLGVQTHTTEMWAQLELSWCLSSCSFSWEVHLAHTEAVFNGTCKTSIVGTSQWFPFQQECEPPWAWSSAQCLLSLFGWRSRRLCLFVLTGRSNQCCVQNHTLEACSEIKQDKFCSQLFFWMKKIFLPQMSWLFPKCCASLVLAVLWGLCANYQHTDEHLTKFMWCQVTIRSHHHFWRSQW